MKHRTCGSAVPATNVHAGHDVDLPSAKVLGAARGRRQAFRPPSVVNISAMSFGSLSGAAVEALNRGAAIAGCLHNTGEGGVSPYHRKGGELVYQIGDRKSTRLNSSHANISYAVFCLKKKKQQ